MKKFGKQSDNLLGNYVLNNKKTLAHQKIIDTIYKEQPKRQSCELCSTKISNTVDLKRGGISYTICTHCGHLNGEYKITNQFNEKIYCNTEEEYATKFLKENISEYETRIQNIYTHQMLHY